jgi:hypothetical protein
LLPTPQVCLSCHSGAKKLSAEPSMKAPRALTVTKFNHVLHGKFGNIAPLILKAVQSKNYLSYARGLPAALAAAKHPCMACHRSLDKSDRVSLANFPAMADCLVCHTSIDPPFSCEKCHDPGANLKPANHTPDWLDRHSSGRANLNKASCAVCHGRTFTCLGCH